MNDRSRTSLTRHAGIMREPDPDEAKRKAKEAYRRTDGQIVLINREWLTSYIDQKQLDILAVKVFDLGKGET